LSSANLLGNSIGVEQAQALLKTKEAKPGLTTLCGLSGDETELDLSGKGLGPGCAILLAPEMEASGSLSCVNLLKNDTPVEQAQELVKIKGSKPALKSLCGLTMDETELDFSSQRLRAGDAVLLASDIQDMGSLSKLDLSGNDMGGWRSPGGAMTALGVALKASGTVTDLNISQNDLKPEDFKRQDRFETGFVEALQDMGPLSSLTFNGCVQVFTDLNGGRSKGWKEGDPVTIDTTMTEADFSGKKLGALGAQILVAFMSSKIFQDKGLLSKLTWSGEQWLFTTGNMNHARRIEDAPPVTLDTTVIEADFSNKHLGASGAMILAAFISSRIMKDSGSLSKLTFCGLDQRGDDGDVRDAGGRAPVLHPRAVTIDTTMTEADFSEWQLGALGGQVLAAFMSTKLFEAKGSLSKLSWSSSFVGIEASVTLDTTMIEADFSNTPLGVSGAMILAAFISSKIMKDSGSLSKLAFRGDCNGARSKSVTVEIGMTEADFSGALLQSGGAIILAAWLEHKVQHMTPAYYC
jgi:hypothetical protein